jgi:DNA-binding NarL/FixJ family response regulator
MTRVLIVDDHDFFRQIIADLVDAADDLETVGECSDGTQVRAAVAALRPHVVLMDLRMPGMSGLEATRALTQAGADARVIMLTTEDSEQNISTARVNGAAGYLQKGTDIGRVLDAVRRVAAGRTAWPEDLHGEQVRSA